MTRHADKSTSPAVISRRTLLCAAGATAAIAALPAQSQETPAPPKETYATHAKGLRILPGMWRPHYPWEHIAWISPSWPCQDYLWLDFPEAIFTSQGLLFLSHVNPPIPTVFKDLPQVPWTTTQDGIAFERTLPNGVVFGGSVTKESESAARLDLRLMNGTSEPLNDITLQTCAFLRAIKEFGDYTRDNKYVHIGASGWTPIGKAMAMDEGDAPYRVGWRTSGKRVADLPIAVAVSNEQNRFMAFTWGKATLSMVSNPGHPCVHADPQFPNLEPGASATIRGRVSFHEGNLNDFDYKSAMDFEA